jgi:hypothetical protein
VLTVEALMEIILRLQQQLAIRLFKVILIDLPESLVTTRWTLITEV